MKRAVLTVCLVFLGGCGGNSGVKGDGGNGGNDGADDASSDAAPAATGGAAGGDGGAGGDSDASDAPPGADGAGGVDGGVDGGTGGIPGVGCPATFPTSGGTCAPPNLLCTYGTAPRPECRDRAQCQGGAWAAMPTICTTSTTGCPATPPAQTGTVACPGPMVGQTCEYPDNGNGVECRCAGDPTQTGLYVCNRPTAPDAPCPAKLPNAGTPCDTATFQGIVCAYPCAGALYLFGERATCSTSGIWIWTQTSCTN